MFVCIIFDLSLIRFLFSCTWALEELIYERKLWCNSIRRQGEGGGWANSRTMWNIMHYNEPGLSRFSVRMLQEIKEGYKSQGMILRQKLTLCSLSPWCNNYNLLKIYNFFLNYSCKGDQLIWFFECYLGKEILCKCFPCC